MKLFKCNFSGAGISRVATSDTEPGSRKFLSDDEEIMRDKVTLK
jgi:hypothetical protein